MKTNKNIKLNELVKINTFIYKAHEKGMKMDYHSHKEIEITYILDGKVELNYFNKKKHFKSLILSEQIILINKNVIHKLKFPVDTTLLVLEIEDINSGLISYFEQEQFIKKNTKVLNFFKHKEPLVKTLYDTSNVAEKMKYLIDFEKRKHKYPNDDLLDLEFHIYFKDFILGIYKCYLTRHNQKNIRIDECLNYIHNNLSSDLTVETIAKEINISEAYLKTLFKKEVGTTIYQYIINQRIKLAIEYLSTTSLSQKEIAKKIGFKSYNSFYKCFIEQTNKKPRDFQTSKVKDMQYFNFDFKKIENEEV